MQNIIDERTKEDLKTVLDLTIFNITEDLHSSCAELDAVRRKKEHSQSIERHINQLNTRGATIGRLYQSIAGDDIYIRRYKSFSKWLEIKYLNVNPSFPAERSR